MTNIHPTKRENKKISDFLKDMQYMFGLQNYDRSFVYEKQDYKERAAQVEVYEDYQRIKIYIYPVFFKHTLEEQRMFLLHELTHYLTDSINEVAYNLANGRFKTDDDRKDACEKSTSMVVNILDKFLASNMDEYKKYYNNYLKK